MTNPSVVVLLKLYSTHRRFFYLDYFKNFKLFANWYLQEEYSEDSERCAQLPWYRANYEIQELAKILKCTEQQVLAILEEIYNDY